MSSLEESASRPSRGFAGRGRVSSAGGRRWVREIVGGGRVVEVCPVWCVSSHLTDGRGFLPDLVHWSAEVAWSLLMPAGSDGSGGGPCPVPVLAARVQVEPYSEDAARRRPYVAFEPWWGEDAGVLSAEEFGVLLGGLRAHLDRLEVEVLARAVAARAGAL